MSVFITFIWVISKSSYKSSFEGMGSRAGSIESQDKLDNLGNESLVEQHSFSSQNELFQETILIATLTDKFGLKKFKPFQKEIILSVLERKDTVVIQPTGSGKSLCFQFPAIS